MRGALAFLLVGLTLSSVVVFTASPATAGEVLSLPVLDFGSPTSSPSPGPLDAPFSPNVRVSDDGPPGSQNEITMAVASDGRIHMGWNDLRQPNPDYRCGYSHSTDGGATWAANQMFHLAGWEADGDPVLVVDGNDAVHFICMPFNRSTFTSRIVVYKSTDGGVTWALPVIASDTVSGLNDKPWAFVAGNTIHLCYANFGASPQELRYTRSTDGGQTWAPTRVVDRSGNGCVFAVDGIGTVVLAWTRGGGIYSFRSTDAGLTWSAPIFVGAAPFTFAGDQRAGSLPMIAGDTRAGNRNVYLVWTANDGLGTWDVRFSRSTDGGSTWSGPISVNDVATNRQFMPGIDVDDLGVVHVSWYDNRTGRMTYRYSYSSDGGLTWAPSVRVTDTEWVTSFFIGDYTALVADSFGFVNCGWADFRSGSVEAYFSRATSAGSPRLARIDVLPPEAWTDADTPVLFTATGYNQFGQVYPINPTWQATGGTVGGGLYMPALRGDWRVWANQSGVSGSAIVHVSPGALARIDVSPADVTITADDTQIYAATGYDAKGNAVAVVDPSWGVTDGSIGPVGFPMPEARFTPRRVGMWTVFANESGVTGFTSVTVVPGALAVISVLPPFAAITADDVQLYTATGTDAKGNAVTIAPSWWAGGGAIDGTGRYAAQRVGLWSVYANASGISGRAEVSVSAGVLATIDVTPKDAVITADEILQYTARGNDADGNPVAITPVWSVAAGTIDAGGLYTPGPLGTHVITAISGGLAGSTTVSVLPGALARIDVVPSAATITADDFLQLTAEGFDRQGNRVAIAPAWATTCGTIDGTGFYTPGPARLCVAYANESGISGSAAVTVLPGALARIDVLPPVAAITADETLPFTANGFDAKGNVVAIAPAWTVPEGTIDGTGLYIPRYVGTWEVRATVSSVFGTATVIVSPGVLAVIEVDPPQSTVRADRTLRFTARGLDAKGNEVPLVSPGWAVPDGTVLGGLFAPEHVGVWNVSATEAGVTGTAAATVIPGAIARVEITPTTSRVAEGGVLEFTATAYDAKGNPVPDAAFTWRTEGGVGTVDGEGRFTATHGGAGRVVVTATDGEGSATATAGVLVDSGLGVVLPGILAVLVATFLLLFLLWRRRRREPPPAGR